MKTIEYIIFTLLFVLPIGMHAMAQAPQPHTPQPSSELPTGWRPAAWHTTADDAHGYAGTFSLGNVKIDTLAQDFTHLTAAGLTAAGTEAGTPALPLFHQLIVLPPEGACSVELTHDKSHILMLPDSCPPLFPAQPSAGKETEPAFQMDSTAYAADHFYGDTTVQLQEIGILQGQRIALLTIRPIAYNPAKKLLRIHDSVSIAVRYESAAGKSIAHYQQAEAGGTVPPVYMVVSIDSFRSALQPFIAWKRQQGFEVETLFAAAWQRDTLRARLQARHDSATALHPVPSYLLLAGDAAQIPPFQGSASLDALGPHATDLYYAEYTGDRLPDVTAGRFSAQSIGQLAAIVQKTVAYEQCALTDTAHLRRCLLVAGSEERVGVDTLTNGQVNYLKEALRDASPGMDTFCFYNPTSDNRRNDILAAWRQGIGSVNYSAHCLASGWHHPQLTGTDIDSLPSDGKYCFVVNNCCHSNDFSGSCFGEALLRKAGGGAVGVIGATSETLWNEDYYWAIGAKQPFSLHPIYDSLTLGAFDRLLHRRGEARHAQAATLGELLTAGNCAVTAYGSPYADYYWEVYCLLGDPSLMPYIGSPATMQLTMTVVDGQPVPTTTHWEEQLTQGATSLTFNATPYARVAAVQDTILLGSCLTDSTGQGIMTLRQPLMADSITLTATAQNCIPYIERLATRRHSSPLLVVESYALTDASNHATDRITSNDTLRIVTRWRNAGGSTAHDYELSLRNAFVDSLGNIADTAASFQASILGSPYHLDSLPCDSTVKTAYTIIIHANGQIGTLAGLPPSSDTATALPDDITLYAVSTHGGRCQSQALHFDMERACIVLRSVRLLQSIAPDPHDNAPTNQLLPGQDYWIELVASNISRSRARTSRLCITHYEGASFLANCCHAGVALAANRSDTLFLPLHTTDTLSRLFLSMELDCDNSHTYYKLIFIADSAMEGFEEGTFAHFPWDTTNARPWTIDSTTAHSGRYAIRSAQLNDRQHSDLQLTLRVNARDTIAFWVKNSSQSNADKLTFCIDETVRGSWSGLRNWHRVQYLILPGTHTLTWNYQKDESLADGNDCAWIDDLRLPLACLSEPAGYSDSVVANVAIPPIAEALSFALYPNPARQEVRMENTSSVPLLVTLTDAMGRQHGSLTLPAGTDLSYSLRHLPAGAYIIAVRRHNSVDIKKLLVIK